MPSVLSTLAWLRHSGTDEQAGHRAEQLRWAFNSPFWPFVLATTSVGQEGLDFHTYCHAVVHWNLPSNPVDMEQREGRIHRYKGHAVRKNLAADFGGRLLRERGEAAGCGSGRPDVLRDAGDSGDRGGGAGRTGGVGADGRGGTGRSGAGDADGRPADPWSVLFRHGEEAREEGQTELGPFWVYTGRNEEEAAKIERHVPTLPLSRDSIRLAALRRSLAVYRMVFGQPRQEDLVEFLLEHFSARQIEEWLGELRVDLGVGGHSQYVSGGSDG